MERELKDQRKSFMSGHSSYAFSAATWCILYLQAKVPLIHTVPIFQFSLHISCNSTNRFILSSPRPSSLPPSRSVSSAWLLQPLSAGPSTSSITGTTFLWALSWEWPFRDSSQDMATNHERIVKQFGSVL